MEAARTATHRGDFEELARPTPGTAAQPRFLGAATGSHRTGRETGVRITVERTKLTAERADLEQQSARLAEAIGQHGYSSVLSTQLSKLETRMTEIDRLLAAKPAFKIPKFTDEQITEFLRQECQDFCDVLAGDPDLARQEIQKRIKKLVLTPKRTPDGHVLEVSGDVALLRTVDVLVESPFQRTPQQYIGVSIPLVGIILNPAPLLAARQPQ
jgi:hypothetical protein